LEVHEVYSLDLSQTDLVVLSACQTQISEFDTERQVVSAGDELVGLTRSFFFAGTPTVVASLWSVDSEATTLLMERFYTHLQAGMGKAEALQQAQLETMAEYPAPYFWAAFVLSGDGGGAVTGEAESDVVTTSAETTEPGFGSGLCLSTALLLGLVLLITIYRLNTRRKQKP
jgi:hypothetical protein